MAVLHLASVFGKKPSEFSSQVLRGPSCFPVGWQVLEPDDTYVFWRPLALNLLWF